jgi:hypothetical protein
LAFNCAYKGSKLTYVLYSLSKIISILLLNLEDEFSECIIYLSI